MPLFELICGDSREAQRELPAGSVHTAVTSPPYFQMRDYGRSGQIGQENTPDAFVENLVRVFRETRRVLRDDGTLWINIGDTYASTGIEGGIKRKELIGIPWMLAFALRADGWYLRADVIWSKRNCTPESVRDRPSRSHEYVFLLTKRPHYFYDKDAVREPYQGQPPTGKKAAELANRARLAARAARSGRPSSSANLRGTKWADRGECHGGFVAWNPRGRNRRSVWHLSTQPFKASSVGVTDVDHFAMFPPDLVRPCILAGTSAYGCCGHCGAPYARYVADYEDIEDTWVPTCSCPPADIVPATVLDPFAGAATTGVVCLQEGRRFVGIDLNADYLRLAQARLQNQQQQKDTKTVG